MATNQPLYRVGYYFTDSTGKIVSPLSHARILAATGDAATLIAVLANNHARPAQTIKLDFIQNITGDVES